MPFTEREARIKWCPFVRATVHGAARPNEPHNRVVLSNDDHPTIPTYSRCMGSDCMMWDWDPGQPESDYARKAGGHHANRLGNCTLKQQFTVSC